MPSLPAPRPPSVLVIDDEPVILDILRRVLRANGYVVLTAAGGPAGVELLRHAPGSAGMALVDVRMPGLDGPATLAALRAIDPALPCCFMTGQAGDYDREALRAAGGDAVIAKPFHLDEVVARLRELLPVSPS
jgi:CheY-like chemotaxis protein